MTNTLMAAIIAPMSKHSHSHKIEYLPIPVNKNVNELNDSRKDAETRKLKPTLKAKVLGLVMLVGAGIGIHDKVHSNETNAHSADVASASHNGGDAGVYTVKTNDTLSDISMKVEENIDGVAGNEDYRKLQHELVTQNGGSSLIYPGQKISLPGAADIDPGAEGVQLEKPPK